MLNSVVPELVVNDNITPLLIQKGAQDWKWAFWQDMADIVHMTMHGLALTWMKFNHLEANKLIVSYIEGEGPNAFVEVTWQEFVDHLFETRFDNRRSVVVPAGVVTETSTQWSISVTAVGTINRMLSNKGLGWFSWTKPTTIPWQFFRKALSHFNNVAFREICLNDRDPSQMLFVNFDILDVELPESEEMVSILSNMTRHWDIIGYRIVQGKSLRIMVRNKLS